jgi:hypothetical protein
MNTQTLTNSAATLSEMSLSTSVLIIAAWSMTTKNAILRREKKCTFHAGCWLLTHENTERFLEDVFVYEYNYLMLIITLF